MRSNLATRSALALALTIAATGTVVATSAIGFTAAAILARGTFTAPIHAHSDGVVLNAQKPTDHVVQRIVWRAGSSSGWHRPPVSSW